jgi:hypothetical protein
MGLSCRVTYRCSNAERDNLTRLATVLKLSEGETLRRLVSDKLRDLGVHEDRPPATSLGQERATAIQLIGIEPVTKQETSIVLVLRLDVLPKDSSEERRVIEAKSM